MASFLFLVETIQCEQFRWIYRKNENFPEFLCRFFKSASKFYDSQREVTLIGHVFSNLRTPKDVFRLMSKKSRLR